MSQFPPDLPARLPPPLAPKLRHYLQLLAETAPGLVTACYLTGSLALGAFDEHNSDVDFVACLRGPAAPADLAALRTVHAALERAEGRWKLEGCYLQPGDLGRLPPQIAPCPCCADGVFHPAGDHDLNPVTWWLLKRCGLALLGPEPQALPFTVAWADVAAYMRANLSTYWRAFTRPSRRLPWLLNDWGVQWAVLGVCRPWHSLRVGAITSKTAAGEAMLAQAPPRWQKIVQEGLGLRRGEPSLYRQRWRRAVAATKFIAYAIDECSSEIETTHNEELR
jgi:hypothetical protein